MVEKKEAIEYKEQGVTHGKCALVWIFVPATMV